MSIKYKIFVAIILLSTLATIGIYFFSYDIILRNIETQEKKTLYQNVERVQKVLDKELGSLNSTCLDWAAWDDTYYFVQNKNEHYKNHLLNYENLSNLNVDTILFADLNGNVLYSKTLDQKNHTYIDDSQDLNNINAQISNFLKANNGHRKIAGLMFINNKLAFISIHSTMKTDRTGYPNGFLIMGRYVSPYELKELEDITNSHVVIENNNGLFQNGFDNKLRVDDNNLDFSTSVIDNNTIEAKTALIDINGENSILLTLKSDRFMYNEGYRKFKLFILHFIMYMLIISIMSLIIAQKLFITRLEKLSRFMEKINGNVDMTLRSEVCGNDEISNLAKVTNSMLERIASANMQLGENEKRLSQVIEGSSDGFWDINLLSKVVYLSPRLLEIAGYNLNHPVDPIIALSNVLPKQEFNNIIDFINNPLIHNVDSFKKEYKITTISRETKWLLTKGKVVERDSDGTPLRLAGISADITENKNYEHAIEYLSFHDFLTGLYNRPYLFKELERLNREGKFPLSIIMGDANGLKLINDAFGHKEGDNLLIEIANILKFSCGNDAIIARLGGDEFIILLPEATELQAMVICEKLRATVIIQH